MPRITKRVLDRLRSPVDGKDLFMWDAGDGSTKGFGVRMKPSGAASYLVQYRNKEARTRRLVLGKVGTLTPDAARTLGMTATILEYAKKSLGLINENPARGIKKPPDRKQRRFLSILEITTMGGVIRNAEKEAGNATALAAIRLLLLTGLRRTEALALRRTWLD